MASGSTKGNSPRKPSVADDFIGKLPPGYAVGNENDADGNDAPGGVNARVTDAGAIDPVSLSPQPAKRPGRRPWTEEQKQAARDRANAGKAKEEVAVDVDPTVVGQ